MMINRANIHFSLCASFPPTADRLRRPGMRHLSPSIGGDMEQHPPNAAVSQRPVVRLRAVPAGAQTGEANAQVDAWRGHVDGSTNSESKAWSQSAFIRTRHIDLLRENHCSTENGKRLSAMSALERPSRLNRNKCSDCDATAPLCLLSNVC